MPFPTLSTSALRYRTILISAVKPLANKKFLQLGSSPCISNIVCRKTFIVDNNHAMAGVRVHFESGQDVYEFIIRQPEFDWEVVPTLEVINIITGQMQNFDIVYTPTGVVID